eukprot:gb/GEZN01024667.1/.p1 GENE.gb/GEZN01024667.1/~~gb/GEZN01024667.1/.p1  ORF type:complete len:169 (-),score=5.28 gb/GEZN01024667.1/:13-519(-)
MSISICLAAFLIHQTISIWPQPQIMLSGQKQLAIAPDTFKIISESNNPIIQEAITRYRQLLFPFDSDSTKPVHSVLTQLLVSVKNPIPYPILGSDMDESYSLNISVKGAFLSSPEVWGSLRGLETFSQIVTCNISTATATTITYFIGNTPMHIQVLEGGRGCSGRGKN